MRTFYSIAIWLSGAVAGVSILALPVWLLGAPGVDNSYAKGWKVGLYVVLFYPILWACLFVFWRIARKHVVIEHEASLATWVGAGSLALLAAAAAVLVVAFKIMSRP